MIIRLQGVWVQPSEHGQNAESISAKALSVGVGMKNKKDKKYWCDICEKEVKGEVFKIKNKGFVLYLCSKHIHM